jgi:probable rRNA maturation factor
MPGIEISVEAGEWAPEGELLGTVERAIGAALAELAALDTMDGTPPKRAAIGATAAQVAELSILFTGDEAMRELNARWRGVDKPTNVLSFPQVAHSDVAQILTGAAGLGGSKGGNRQASVLLGDIVLASETIRREAGLARKPLEDHIAHLIIHAFLHLLGYDHEAEAEAEEMEQLERAALKRIGIADPYAVAHTQ